MSSFFSRLRSGTRRLKVLLQDVKQSIGETPDWNSKVSCDRTLGAETPVERWYLAEFFLTRWCEWESLFDRYLRYFGAPSDKIPNTWRDLKQSCSQWQERFWRDRGLDARIASSWKSMHTGLPEGEPDTRALYREIIASRHRLLILPGDDVWPESTTTASAIDHRLRDIFDASDPDVKRTVVWHLRKFRHATLDASWLDEQRWRTAPAAFEYSLGGPTSAPDWGAARTDLTPRQFDWQRIEPVLIRIVQAIHEIGFDSFVADVTSREMAAGPDSPLGGVDVEVLPREFADSQYEPRFVQVALAQGLGRGREALPAVLDRVAASLFKSDGVFTIVVCDAWDASLFEDRFFQRFRELYDRGRRFEFLLVGAATAVARIPIVFSTQGDFAHAR